MRFAIRIVLLVTAIAAATLPFPAALVERVYSERVYGFIQPRLTSASNATHLALFDIALILAVAAIVGLSIRRWRGRRRGGLRTAIGLAGDMAMVVSVAYLWFLTCWGLNYRREPLRSKLDFDESRITADALRALATRNVTYLNSGYGEAHRSGWPPLDRTPAMLDGPFAAAQNQLGMKWRAEGATPKRSLLNLYFARVSIDGMTDPFFLETLANGTLLPFERPFVVAHEWSHLAGYADESEANFVGWLICMNGPVAAQYSAWISLYGTIVSALPQSERTASLRGLDTGPREDLRTMSERIRTHVSPSASRAGYAMYDKFLKANRVQAGIRSYSEVLRLLLGARFQNDGAPMLRNRAQG